MPQTKAPRISPKQTLRFAAVLVPALLITGVLSLGEGEWRVLWPPILALATVILLRQVILGLLLGAFAGVVIINGGHWLWALYALFVDHLFPNFTSSWKLGALTFTFLLGGFAALLEAGGGLQALVSRFLNRGDARRNLQLSTIGLGLICFFDGLANSILLGRVTRSLATACRVSKVKLAYIVDATSSGVACIAFISTWIATQLTLIRDGLNAVGRADDFSAYGVFFASIPHNFYVLFTLAFLVIVVLTNWDIGPMKKAEQAAQARRAGELNFATRPGSPLTALVPLAVLVGSIMLLFYLWEARPLWPPTWEKIALAFSSGDGALILVLGSILGVAAAWFFYPRDREEMPRALPTFVGGVRSLMVPLIVLLAAWILGSVLGDLGTAAYVSHLLEGRLSVALIPAAVFLTGAMISFTTGTSWGTMGLLMPLAVPLVFTLGVGPEVPLSEGALLAAVVGAVFSGAVFGDHCSPFSDTTIVASVATGVSPLDHVKTQLPYALIAAVVATLIGFAPVGAGWFPPIIGLLLGVGVLVAIPLWGNKWAK